MSKQTAALESLPKISPKSSEETVFAAYQKALDQLNAKQIETTVVNKREKEAAAANNASQHTAGFTVKSFAISKIDLIKRTDNLSEQMAHACNQLYEIQQMISIEKIHLNDLYDINETVQTLPTLTLAQQKQKEDFEAEMQQEEIEFKEGIAPRKESWKQQQELLMIEYKERKEQLEKDRKREKECCKYNLGLKRRKEPDAYSAQKTVFEKELGEMCSNLDKFDFILKAKETEVVDLRHKVETFLTKLAKTGTEAEQVFQAKLTSQFNFAKKLREKEIVELKLGEQKISALENKIKEQTWLIAQLTQKTDVATKQIQLIACRALDISAQKFGQIYQ